MSGKSGKTREVDLILAGGGALGIAYCGVLRALHEHGIRPARLVGTSAGSLIASLSAAGYEAPEIEWLIAPSDAGLPRPETLPTSVTEPLRLSDFLDPPASAADIGADIMRRTHLWRAIKLNAVDELLGRKLEGLPEKRELADELTDRIVNLSFGKLEQFNDGIKRVLNTALHFYPDDKPSIRSFLPGTLERLRTNVADAAWRAFTDNVTEYRMFVNWGFEGGLFEGEVLYQTVRDLIEAKVNGGKGSPVVFGDLPRELGVVTANVGESDWKKRLRIHTRMSSPDMEVAQAVRDSSSVPLFFQSRKRSGNGAASEVVDGGVIANYPFWVFTGGHDGYFRPDKSDEARPKLGFILDPNYDAPTEWDCPAPKWHEADSRMGMLPRNSEALAQNQEFAFLSPEGPLGEFAGVELAFRVVDVIITAELSLTEQWREMIRKTYPYHEACIPLKGFHWLDFTANSEEISWRGMVDRGYEAASRLLVDAGLVPARSAKANPYRSGSR